LFFFHSVASFSPSPSPPRLNEGDLEGKRRSFPPPPSDRQLIILKVGQIVVLPFLPLLFLSSRVADNIFSSSSGSSSFLSECLPSRDRPTNNLTLPPFLSSTEEGGETDAL